MMSQKSSNMFNKKDEQNVSAFSIRAAHISMVATATFVVLLIILHIIEPEFDPSWRMISEYELGSYGWLMQLAFFFLALGSISLIVTIWSKIRYIVGYIGLFLITVASIGMIIAGTFITDPITISRDAWSTHGTLHGWGAFLVIPIAPIAATLISWTLTHHTDIWIKTAPMLWSITSIIWLSLIGFILGGGTQFNGTRISGGWTGWMNRAFILAYCVWVMAVVWEIIKVYQKKTRK